MQRGVGISWRAVFAVLHRVIPVDLFGKCPGKPTALLFRLFSASDRTAEEIWPGSERYTDSRSCQFTG
jgi:hypothetical protein